MAATEANRPRAAVPDLRSGVPVFALIALAIAIHAPFIGGGFLTDDFLHLDRLRGQTLGGALVSPDVFGFYRPVPQASLLITLQAGGANAALMRLTNLGIHAAVVCAAYFVARLLLGRAVGAALATLVFVLTPKAHPIAVLWISARAELLMALFVMTAIIGWIRWDRGDGSGWLGLALLGYALALTCKETAVLLPLLLIATPPGARAGGRARLTALGAMCALAAVFAIGRLQTGALLPISADPHYDMSTPFGRWLRNGRNYFWRAIVSPLALVVVAAAARSVHRRWRLSWPALRPLAPFAIYAGLWFALFILPVLPIASRSEHYLYLPVFGLCVLAGAVADLALSNRRVSRRVAAVALALYVLGGSFQVSRARALYEDAVFSARLIDAVRANPAIDGHRGSVIIAPGDAVTRRFLQDAIGGYISPAVDLALGRHVPAGLGVSQGFREPDALVLECQYRDGVLSLAKAVE